MINSPVYGREIGKDGIYPVVTGDTR
jgi:hypothetical protein